ncbi:MAG: hypothetical protein AAB393_12430, partial [Bacteroidota bacterium]
MRQEMHTVGPVSLGRTRRPATTTCCLLMLLLTLSCNETNIVVENPHIGLNRPTITVSPNVFTFSVDAVGLAFLGAGEVAFTTDSLAYTLSITGYRQGGGLFSVLDISGNVILSDSLNSDRSLVNTTIAGRIPSRFSVSLANFTGRVSIVLVGSRSVEIFRLQDFPNTIGTRWTYAIYDSLAQRADTAVVTVLGQTVLPNIGSATIWRTAYRSRTDSQYVKVSGD